MLLDPFGFCAFEVTKILSQTANPTLKWVNKTLLLCHRSKHVAPNYVHTHIGGQCAHKYHTRLEQEKMTL